MISHVHHKPLVSLVGYCITGSQNKNMEFHLHGKGQPTMEWPTRMRIALGAAKGLAYLHEDCKLTDKSDVYAFGIVLLELLTGRKPVDNKSPTDHHQSLVTWAMPQLIDRSKLNNILDPIIRDKMDLKHLYQVAAVAILCVQPEPSYRPLITDVLHSLISLVPVEIGGSLHIT
ncbi:hypothetical protein RDABS01_015483 [Bienertia sinuspersici]